jgi:hypothetical protein
MEKTNEYKNRKKAGGYDKARYEWRKQFAEEIEKYDDLPLELEKSQYPKSAVSLKQNPDRESKVKWVFLTEEGTPLCSAKRSGWHPTENPSYCARLDISKINGRCKLHGGTMGRGIHHPQYRHGKSSKARDGKLFQYYQEALQDPEPHKLDAEIALIDGRINELLDGIGEHGGAEVFKAIVDAFRSVNRYKKSKDEFKEQEAFLRLEEAVEDGREHYNSWKEINTLMDQRRRMAIAETKRLEVSERMMPASQVQALIFGIVDAIRQEIDDRILLQKITARFNEVIGEPIFSTNGSAGSFIPERRYLAQGFEGIDDAIDGEWDEEA